MEIRFCCIIFLLFYFFHTSSMNNKIMIPLYSCTIKSYFREKDNFEIMLKKNTHMGNLNSKSDSCNSSSPLLVQVEFIH